MTDQARSHRTFLNVFTVIIHFAFVQASSGFKLVRSILFLSFQAIKILIAEGEVLQKNKTLN